MAVCNLQKLFGKRKRKSSSERCPSPLSSDSKAENSSSCVPSEIREQKHFEPTPTTTPSSATTATTTTPAPAEQSESESTETSTTQSSCTTYGSSSDEDDSHSDLDSKPAAVSARSDDDSSGDSTATAPSTSHFLMLGSDVMISVVSYLEPRETLNVLTMPLCKEWRVSYTSDQELWRTVCCTDPFSADLNRRNPASGAFGNSDREENDDDDDSFCSLSGFDETYDGSKSNCVLGEYRLVYTSFVRCMNYLERIQKNDLPSGNNEPAKKAGKADRMDRFPTFGVTKSLRKFLSRGNERGILKSVIGDGNGDMSSAPIGISSDGSIQNESFSKVTATEDPKKPKFAQSMITSRLWGPSANGVPSHLNLPKSCAIYSIVNWMVAHPNVRGIQTMCIQSLPSLLEDELQRVTGRRVGLVEVILCAMLRFPDCAELHVAVFHSIVLLARPIGGREGMLFDNSMAESTHNIGLTTEIELSDALTLASRCGGLPSLYKSASKEKDLSADGDENDSSPGLANETETKSVKTGISVLVDSMIRFSDCEKLQSMACWALVNVALVPLQKNMLMKLGSMEAILNAMEKHSASFDVQFRALFAFINLVVPCRRSDFRNEDNIDFNEAVRIETAILNRLGARIAELTVTAMKNFCSSEAILNRGCLVVHNLSQSSELMQHLLATPHCYQILEWCVTNHSTDSVLRRSVSVTMHRMQVHLDRYPEERSRFSVALEGQNRETLEQYW